jgi:hypothetical protein
MKIPVTNAKADDTRKLTAERTKKRVKQNLENLRKRILSK